MFKYHMISLLLLYTRGDIFSPACWDKVFSILFNERSIYVSLYMPYIKSSQFLFFFCQNIAFLQPVPVFLGNDFLGQADIFAVLDIL